MPQAGPCNRRVLSLAVSRRKRRTRRLHPSSDMFNQSLAQFPGDGQHLRAGHVCVSCCPMLSFIRDRQSQFRAERLRVRQAGRKDRSGERSGALAAQFRLDYSPGHILNKCLVSAWMGQFRHIAKRRVSSPRIRNAVALKRAWLHLAENARPPATPGPKAPHEETPPLRCMVWQA